MSGNKFEPELALRHAEGIRSRAKRVEEEVSHTEIDVTSRDKSIRVTVTIPGKITDLKLDGPAVEDQDPTKLSEAILATVQTAQEIAERAGQDLVKRHLPNLPNLGEVISSARKKGPDPQ